MSRRNERHATVMQLRADLLKDLSVTRQGCHYLRHLTDAALECDTVASKNRARGTTLEWRATIVRCRRLVRQIRALDATLELAACYLSVSK